MVLAGYTVRRRVPLPPPRTGRRALRRPQRDRPARRRGGGACRHPAHAARHVLPRTAASASGPATCSRGSATARPTDGPSVSPSSTTRRRAASERRSTRCGPSTRSRSVVVAAWAADSELAAPRPRLRAAAGERRLPRRLRRDAGRPVRRRRRAERSVHGRPRDPRRAATTSSALADRRSRCCICPTTERELADGIGPTAALRDAGVDAVRRVGLPRRDRPVRGDAGGRARRAAGLAAPRAPTDRPTC